MCHSCMEDSTKTIIESTGVHPLTMEAIDSLTSAALDIGAMDLPTGDPLYPFKYVLALYLAKLERHVVRTKTGEPISIESVGREAYDHIQTVWGPLQVDDKDDEGEADADRPHFPILPKGSMVH